MEAETEAWVKVEAKGLALRIAGEENDGDDNDDNNNNNNGREETPLTERAAVAKAIARSLGEQGEAKARPEAGPGDDR